MSIGWYIPEVLQDACCTPETCLLHRRSYFGGRNSSVAYSLSTSVSPRHHSTSAAFIYHRLTQSAAVASLWQVSTVVSFPKERTLINVVCKATTLPCIRYHWCLNRLWNNLLGHSFLHFILCLLVGDFRL
jgi:hypothetical protein